MRRRLIATSVSVAGLLLAACGSAAPSSQVAGASITDAAGSPKEASQQARQITLGTVLFNDRGTKNVSGKSEEEMEADDFYFMPTFLSGSPGQKLRLKLENDAAVAHTFTIASENVDVLLQPKDKAEVEVTFPQSGAMQFLCRFHTAQGMNGELLAGTTSPQPPGAAVNVASPPASRPVENRPAENRQEDRRDDRRDEDRGENKEGRHS